MITKYSIQKDTEDKYCTISSNGKVLAIAPANIINDIIGTWFTLTAEEKSRHSYRVENYIHEAVELYIREFKAV